MYDYGIYVDVSNILINYPDRVSLMVLQWKLQKYFNARVITYHLFISLPGDRPCRERRIADAARRQPWYVVHDEHRQVEMRDGRRTEKGVDVDLACQVMEDAMRDKHDFYVIVSADSDFLPLARRLRKLGRQIKIVGPYHATTHEVRDDPNFTNIFDVYPPPQVEQTFNDNLDDDDPPLGLSSDEE
ncbi:TPA: hypothetical protein DDY56_02460 [Candidatus Uhrbacteria bacterium]|nr:MAG: hypothetical protein A2317_03690 [Candidatus Uhrbacteria bacterium RIFOXYB2_FULL_41_10]HAL49812.1 hypothetical protein [Candidatus Uhrbacteria bacterium]HAN06816.1 hypothetical protein [Candidatus Uhrbacteria bacterium]HAP65935.1 hypothetical protein [Candidatus Uhrbacteria bacterium]HBA51889.1 hypothetical protein [Candidatus Uhrbacteria bacterium]